ncbi:MAG: CHC2 zinc finger domain-containing protein [Candidatus Sungiibacteriota bacterium]
MNSPVEEIKSRIDVAELVGSYIRLTRAGANMKALCPFHTEKTPSFNVSPARQIWHCFGCGKGGDIFKFVMEIEGLDFPEALRQLAKRAGVELRREDPRIRSERNRLYDLLEDSALYFQNNLGAVTAIKAYLKKRGVAEKTIADFRIGFSFDSWDGLLRYLTKKGYKEQEVEKAGLAVKGESGSWYDRFRSRIIFPVADGSGKVVGFGGRIFEPVGVATVQKSESGPSSATSYAKASEVKKAAEGQAKYINTPQTLVYDKSRVLYAFDKAKESIRKKNSCVIVEGYMDAVMSHQAGITNAVAVSGTALTSEQLKMIRRLADTLVSSFDRDSAGEAATKRSLDLAAEFNFERKAALLPEGIKDPADAVLASPEIWLKATEGALPIVQFYFEQALSRHNPATAQGVKAISQAVLPELSILTNEMEKSHWVVKLAAALGVSEESVWQELGKAKKELPGIAVRNDDSGEALFAKTRKEHLEELSLGSLAFLNHLAPRFKNTSHDIFSKDIHKNIFKQIIAGGAQAPEEFQDYLNQLAFKAEVFLELAEDKDGEVQSLMQELRGEYLKEQRDEITRRISEAEKGGNESLVSLLSEEYKNVCNELQGLTAH